MEETCRNLNRQLREVREDNEASARIHAQHLDQLQADKGRLEQLLAASTADSKLLRDQSNRSMMDHRSDMQQLRLDLENERGRCAELSSEKAKLVIELDSVTRRVERMEMELAELEILELEALEPELLELKLLELELMELAFLKPELLVLKLLELELLDLELLEL